MRTDARFRPRCVQAVRDAQQKAKREAEDREEQEMEAAFRAQQDKAHAEFDENAALYRAEARCAL